MSADFAVRFMLFLLFVILLLIFICAYHVQSSDYFSEANKKKRLKLCKLEVENRNLKRRIEELERSRLIVDVFEDKRSPKEKIVSLLRRHHKMLGELVVRSNSDEQIDDYLEQRMILYSLITHAEKL